MKEELTALGRINPVQPNSGPRSMHEPDGRSRHLLLRQIADIVPFSSLLDVGQGRWVEAALDAGADDVWSLHVGPEPALRDPRARTHRASHGERWVLERRFDMAVAFGADDGQPGERAATIVSDLCALSDVILFSSADPLEAAMSGAFRSWPEVWALLFRDEGFSCFDLFGRQPSLIDEPGLIPSHAVLFVRRGSDAAERLDPWSADGLCRTCYTPDAVISFLKNAISRQPEDIEEARQSYRQGLDRIAAPLGSGFLAKDTPILRRLRRERDHARSMLAIEYQGGRITGERLGLAKGRDAERVRLEAERWEREGELTRTAERVHTELLKREDDFAQAADQFHAEISTLETESQRLRDIVTGFRQAYFRYSMDRRTRIISSLLPWFLKSRLHKRWLDRALDEIRRSTMFDAEYYLKENPDVKLTGMDPAEHYFISGAREGRNPSARFDTTGYIMKHCTEFNEGVNPLLDMIRSNRPHEQ